VAQELQVVEELLLVLEEELLLVLEEELQLVLEEELPVGEVVWVVLQVVVEEAVL